MAEVIGTKGDDFIHVAGDGRTAPEGYTDLPAATNGANTAKAGNQAFHLSGTGGHAGDLVVHYDAAHHRTVIDLYVDNNASVDARILLTGQHVLHASDFVL